MQRVRVESGRVQVQPWSIAGLRVFCRKRWDDFGAIAYKCGRQSIPLRAPAEGAHKGCPYELSFVFGGFFGVGLE